MYDFLMGCVYSCVVVFSHVCVYIYTERERYTHIKVYGNEWVLTHVCMDLYI